MIHRRLAFALPLLSCGCENVPPPSALPPQREPVAEFRSYRVDHLVRFAEGDMTRVVQDILAPSGGWSWSGKRPTVKLKLRGGLPVRYAIDFAVAEATFQSTGPVSVTFFINDHTLRTARYTAPGPQRYEAPVPEEWLREENLVGAEVDKVWTSADDGAQLGLILNSVGLIEQ